MKKYQIIRGSPPFKFNIFYLLKIKPKIIIFIYNHIPP